MASIDSPQFGRIDYTDQEIVDFPHGVPGFEWTRRFVAVEPPAAAPLVILQSLDAGGPGFLAIPVEEIAPDYRLGLSADEQAALALDAAPLSGPADLRCFVIITIPRAGQPTANLMAPVVIRPELRRGVQSIQLEGGYSFEHPLFAPPSAGVQPCS